jgi:hypothetical protein
MGRLTYASWPEGRVFGFHADPDGVLELRLGPFDADVEITINYEAEPNGRVRGEVVDVAECSLAEAASLEAEGIREPLRWKHGTRVSSPGQPIRLRLHANKARVYGFEVNRL